LQTEVHVVVSTLSGTQGALPFFENALKPLLEHLRVPKYQVHKTQSARTILELCEQIFVPRARDGVEQTIILLSGDGGVIDIIAAFSHDKHQKTPPTICLIPMGTGNATANSALASDSTFGLSALIRGTPRVLPTFKATLSSGSVYLVDEGRQREPVCQNADDAHVYGAVVLSWGMHASLVADADTHEYRKFGVDRFKMAAKELLWPSDGSDTHHYSGTVTLTVRNEATRTLETVGLDRSEHMYILTTMVSQLEKGFAISPASKPLDGQLRLVHFGVLAPERAMELMGLAYQGGKHVSEPEVSYEAVEKVRIEFKEESERWRRVCIDGKIAAVSEGGWLEIEKADAEFVQLVVSS
jgi:diacylglycerol kinase family enzyme